MDKSLESLNRGEEKKTQYDCVTKNIITSALNIDEFFMIS